MFLVNNYGDHVTEVKDVKMVIDYTSDDQIYAHHIYDKIMSNAYNFGSTEKAKIKAKAEMDLYLESKSKICKIMVNSDFCFGVYEDINEGKHVFDYILHEFQAGELFCDLRIVDSLI